MWLDQLESDAVQAQETEGSLAQQYQVSLCWEEGGGAFSHVCCLNWVHWAQTFLL